MELNQNNLEDYSFRIANDDGSETICDTLAVVSAEGYENPIIIYTDYTMNKNRKFNTYESRVVPFEAQFKLEAINNYMDIPEVVDVLNNLQD